MTKAILLSGGMDSFALTYKEKPDIAITVDYGQRSAKAELQSSQILCKELGVPHHILRVDMSELGSGDLSDLPAISIAPASDWWPYRNQMLITLAAMFAVRQNVGQLIIGCVASDSNHVDGSVKFIESIAQLLEIQEGGMTVVAPAINMTSDELINESGIPQSLLAWAHSCHTGNLACGHCRGCVKHRNITHVLGLVAY